MEREPFALTLFDYRDELQWVRLLGWSDEQLRSVPVHEQFPAGEECLDLANWAGTALGVTEAGGGGPTSADTRSIRNMWVCRAETPPELWDQLKALYDKGGPSGYETGVFGETGEDVGWPKR